MKFCAALLLLTVLLSGCDLSNDCMDIAISLRNQILSAQSCSFQCEITADYADRQYSFSMDCVCDQLGNVSFCVMEPESIRDIRGNIDSSEGNLTFDDYVLSFPVLADGYLSPVSVPWLFIKTMRGGYILSCGEDSDGYRITVNDTYDQKALQLDVWVDGNSIPVFCDVLWDGRRILSMNISKFTCV